MYNIHAIICLYICLSTLKISLLNEIYILFNSIDPKAETRLYIMVNDYEFHVYNRSSIYAQLQELFGLEPTIIPPKTKDEKAQENGQEQTHTNLDR